MAKRSKRQALVIGSLLLLGAWASPAGAAPDPEQAERVFADAKTICDRDDGVLWGKSICGPIFVVDYQDRAIIANEPDDEGHLAQEGEYYRGVLPESVIIANTPTDGAGKRWTQLIAPVYEDDDQRHVLIAHELFHRMQTASDAVVASNFPRVTPV